jgi:hypothetical protein
MSSGLLTHVLGQEVKASSKEAEPHPCLRHTAKEDAPALLVSVKNESSQFLYAAMYQWGATPPSSLPAFDSSRSESRKQQGRHALSAQGSATGRWPIALAPEGQVSITAIVVTIEMGVANLASWALESGKMCCILPIASVS